MFNGQVQFNLDSIIDVTVMDIGVAFIRTYTGYTYLNIIPKCIEKVLHIVDIRDNSLTLITKHRNRNEQFIDVLSFNKEDNKSDFL